MNLGKNINSLLKRYAEVYVPGIGVFKRIHSPAQFDKQNNVFLPPISYVELDYSAQHGFNIVHYIQQQENLGLNQAQQILSETVDKLRADLGQFGQVKLDDLGLLISYGASLVFKPLDLSGFDFQPVTNLVAPEIETVVSSLEEAPVVEEDPVVEANDKVEPAIESMPDTEDQDETIEVEEVKEEAETTQVTDPVADELSQETAPTNDRTGLEAEESSLAQKETEEFEPVDATVIADSSVSVTPKEENTSKREIGAIASANANSTYAPNIYEEEPRNSNAIWYWMTGIIVLAMVAVAVVYTNPTLKDSLFGKFKRNRKKIILNTYMTKSEADLAKKSVEKKIEGAWVETL